MAVRPVNMNKINWKKLNDSLANAGLNNGELNCLNNMFSYMLDQHTDISNILFTKQYLFSLLLRVHNYLKETNSINNAENLRDMYDYVITAIIFSLQLSISLGPEVGISVAISRIVNKIFNVDNVMSTTIAFDSRFPQLRKYIIEPIIVNKADKISTYKLKEFADFVFNMFSYTDVGNKGVSVSLLCSSLWVDKFDKLPYLIDDTIIPDFNNNPQYTVLINSLLMTRRNYMLEAFNGGENYIKLYGYRFEDFIKSEPDSLYEEISKLQEKISPEEDEEETDETDDNLDTLNLLLSDREDNGVMAPVFENEINCYSKILNDLNVFINGAIPKSNISLENAKGNLDERNFPRLRKLYKQLVNNEDVNSIIREMTDNERELYGSTVITNNTKDEYAKFYNGIIDDVNAELEAEKEKEQKMAEMPDRISNIDFSDCPNISEQIKFTDFMSYMQDVLDIFGKTDKNIDINQVNKIIKGYNKNKANKNKVILKNISTNGRQIIMEHFKGKDAIDRVIIDNNTIKSTPIIANSPKKRAKK